MKRLLRAAAACAFLFSAAPSAWCGPEEDEQLKEELEAQFRDSKEIHGRYDERYYWDTSDEVRVEVKDGDVILRGIVQDSEAKKAFEKIARQTPGVKSVDARIRVIPSARKVD